MRLPDPLQEGAWRCPLQAGRCPWVASREGSEADVTGAAAQREIAECDAKLSQHRAALEADANAVLVTGWKGTQAKRPAAQARLTKRVRRRCTVLAVISASSELRDRAAFKHIGLPEAMAEALEKCGAPYSAAAIGLMLRSAAPRPPILLPACP